PFGGIDLSQDSIEWIARKRHKFNSTIAISIGDGEDGLVWRNALSFHRSAVVGNLAKLMAEINISTVEVSW
ncbi:hypothetical protein PFISCL1PPCAC_12142, partial [Pristionchus fissidentatus]